MLKARNDLDAKYRWVSSSMDQANEAALSAKAFIVTLQAAPQSPGGLFYAPFLPFV
jgi:hypothetical protein